MQRALGHCDTRRNPDDVRFTKGTMNLNFPIGQLQCENIYDVLYALEGGKLIPRDIPSLRVIFHGGQLWTMDNKLLYICRISPKVQKVAVVQVPGQRFLDKFLKENSAKAIERMSSAEFFPKVDNCDNSPRMDLTFHADRVRFYAVKKIPEKEKGKGKRPSTPSPTKSSPSERSVSSSTYETGRISSKCTEPVTAFSVGFKFVQNLDGKTNSSCREASSTDTSALSSEDTVETKTERYPALRSTTAHHQPEDSLQFPADEEREIACTRRRLIFPSAFAERRPSTCQTSPRFSRLLQRLSSAPRASRLMKRNSSYSFIRLEKRHSKTEISGATDRPSSAAFTDTSQEHVYHSLFASFRENVSPSNSARLPEEISPAYLPHSGFSNFQDTSSSRRVYLSPSFSTESQFNSGEDLQGLPSSEPGTNEPGYEFELEAFVLPDFCSPPGKTINDKGHDDEVKDESPFDSFQRYINSAPISSAQDNLDRSVSSCSSSTERPRNHQPERPEFQGKGGPPRNGSSQCSNISSGGGGILRTFSLLQKSNIGRSLSPLRRASVSAGRSMKCHLSAEHEFQVSKQILLKHMKKAFFSVC